MNWITQPVAAASPPFLNRPARSNLLSGRQLWVAHGMWLITLGLVVLTVLVSLTATSLAIYQGSYLQGRVLNSGNPFADTVLYYFGAIVRYSGALVSLILAAIIIRRRSEDRMAVFVSFYLLWTSASIGGLGEVPGLGMSRPVGFLLFIGDLETILSSTLLPIILLSRFPNGSFAPRWARWLPLMPIATLPLLLISYSIYGSFFDFVSPFTFVFALIWVVIGLLALYAQVYRYRHVSSPVERQQTKWIVYGFGLWIILSLLSSGPYIQALSQPSGATLPLSIVLLAKLTYVPSLVIMPVALTIAVLRHRLWDIDIIINRTLVYAALTASVVAVYALIVGGLGTLIRARESLVISLVATGLIAVLFQSLRERLQRAVNRLMYGERDEPFEVLAGLGRRLEDLLSPQMVYPTIVETVAQTLKLPYAAISVKRGDQFELVEIYGSLTSEPETFPLVHQGEIVGQLLVGRRSANEDFSKSDERLLRSIARQAGAAVHAVQLTADLQQARLQLVTTREEERLRLRRDLHDGLGPALASVVWQADSARDLVDTDPARAVQLLEGTIAQAQAALADIRRLVHGLRPPALDELGLVGALEQSARGYQQAVVKVDAPTVLPDLSAAVEVAVYRITQEAIKNALEHGQAANCTVYLAEDRGIRLTIRDDGRGLPEIVAPGVGLVSMRERAEELGGTFHVRPSSTGGTEIEVYLPTEQEEERIWKTT